jgi:hypothetical protein
VGPHAFRELGRDWGRSLATRLVADLRGPSRTLLALLVVLCACLSPLRALAWVEKGVQSSTVTLQIDADGTAVVQHEIGLGLRGERFKSFTLPGIDADARLVGSATAIRTDGERPAEPLVLEASIGGDALVLRVPVKNGAVGRTFLLRFAYRTDLLARGLLREQPGSGKVELHWSGPRFEDGVDSATLLVRTAPGVTAPEVPRESADTNDGAGNTPVSSNYGTVVSTLRRSNASDEIELVRPHTAKNEAVHWRLNLDAGLFERAAVNDTTIATAPSAPAPAGASARSSPGQTRARGLAWAALLGIVYALLVALKSHWTTRAAQLGGCHARALIDLPRSLRIGLAGLCFTIAATLVMVWEAPVPAALALIGAMLLAAQRSPELDPALRGPGEWRPLGADAFELKPAAPVPGAWLDAGRAPGFALLALLLCGWGFAAASLYTASPYEGACALLASAALLPLFCTGRQRDLPLDPLRHGKVFFRRLSKRLTKRGDVSCTPLGRFAQASGEVDELRLALQPERSLPGLLGLEVALEFHHGIGGAGATPVVLLRAADGSPCYRALPRELVWTRGRTPEERVSLIEPRLPTLAVCEALLRELLVLLAAAQETAPNERKNSARSSGNTLSTVKAATRASPAQAT